MFDINTKQQDVYEDVSALVTSVLDGFNVCIFAYGQTGSGKTWTMSGPPDNRGVNTRALEELFEKVLILIPSSTYLNIIFTYFEFYSKY